MVLYLHKELGGVHLTTLSVNLVVDSLDENQLLLGDIDLICRSQLRQLLQSSLLLCLQEGLELFLLWVHIGGLWLIGLQ